MSAALVFGIAVPAGALLTPGVAAAAPAPAPATAAAPATAFSTSFETAETTQPLVTTVENGPDGQPLQSNISGKVSLLPGSVLGNVVAVTASAENPPSEVAANVADSNSGTKWLANGAAQWLRYQLSTPIAVTKYTLTSANDSLERAPKNFVLQGSADGSTWVDLDTRTNQTFANFFTTNTYSFTNTTAYTYYRLNISAVGSGTLVQLADWDISDGSTSQGVVTPMVTAVGNGPISGYNMKPSAGYTGLKALRYSGAHLAAGRGYGENRLYNVDIPVGADTRLSYRIFPELTGGDLSYPSTNVAVDLHFTDGSYLRDLGAIDQHDFPLTAAGQGKGKILYANQWNQVSSDIGGVAAGKTIDRVLLRYDNAQGKTTTLFQGWLDDVSIDPAPAKVDASSLTNYVDVRRGTNASGSFSRGNNLPISAVPNGFTFFTPVTNATSNSWQYYWQQGNNAANRPVLQGLAISHEPSPWMGDRNQMSIMPAIGTAAPSGNAGTRGLPFSHDNEIAQPDYYKVNLDNGITAEMTPADHGGIMKFTVPASSNTAHVVLDTVDNNGKFFVDIATGTVTGWVDNGSGLSAGRTRMYLYGTFDALPTKTGIATGGRTGTTYVTFDSTTTKTITLRLATSFLSTAQAQHNAELELTGRSFDDVRAATKAAWNAKLGVISTEGGTETQLKTLYSNLYRLNLYPNSQFENTGTAAAPTYFYASPVSATSGAATDTVSNAKKVPGKIYVNNGFWDTYRTVWPAYSLLYPQMAAEIADGFVQQYRDGGWIARWSSPGYADLMTGTSSDVALADAYLKGVKLPDPLSTYDAAVKNAAALSGQSAVGRKGLDTSTFLGYTATSTGESVSWGLEGFINDFGIGNMAAALAEDPATPADRKQRLREESVYYLARSKNYVNMFNPETGFFQGRSSNGTFTPSAATFDPESWGGVYTETNGWNFAFHAPQDGAGLAALYGGKKGLEDKLDTFFSTPETATKPGGYGGVIHEMLEARDVRMGQFGMSNQVSHHIPYMYNFAGAPAKSAAAAREVMQRLYTGGEIGQGYPGDEDNGEMSSWYVLSSLGIYPLQMGAPAYTVGSPLFKKATVHLPGGDLVINAPDNSASNIYVQSLKVNGQAHTQNWVSQSDLAPGSTLDFAMGAAPSTWGTHDADLPVSLTATGEQPSTLADVTGTGQGTASGPAGVDATKLFDDSSKTQVTFADGTAQIGWTFKGKQKPTFYTITSGANPGDPTAWVVQGSNNGQDWTTVDTRSAQTFEWRTETRPFQIASPGSYQQYRIQVTASSAATLNLAEVEFLAGADQATGQPISVDPVATLTGAATIAINTQIGSFNGGIGKKASDYTATVNWGDGTTPTTAVITAGRAGNYNLTASHTYATFGWRQVSITVTDGSTSGTGLLGVDVGYQPTTPLSTAFNRVCIGDEGAGANCDAKNWAYSRAALASVGVVQGKKAAVPGTDLSFTLPVVAAGKPDNVIGGGQTIALALPTDTTKISLIGSGTQGNQNTSGTVTFTDGSSEALAMQFSDWTLGGNANGTPQYGNIVVAKSPYRLSGNNQDGAVPFLFATAPYTIPAGKTIASITLPNQTGTETEAGRIHLFAVADNGSALAAVAASDATATAGTEATVALGTAAKGVPFTTGSAYQAVVQWGDGTAPVDAVVTVDGGTATVSGAHTFTNAGSYLVHVTTADQRGSITTSLTVTVKDAPVPDPVITAAPKTDVQPGTAVTVTGKNFKAGSTITLALGTGPVTLAQIAKGAKAKDEVDIVVAEDGTFSGAVTVPGNAAEGVYSITATESGSGRTATTTITVAEKEQPPVYDPEVQLPATAEQGATVVFNGNGFAPSEQVTLTLLPEGTALGTVTTNGDGVIASGSFVIPADAAIGAHQVKFDGAVSKTPRQVALSVTAPKLKASTTTAAASPNPVPAGTQATVTATVAGSGAVPTGAISVAEGSTVLGSVPLTAGAAELVLPADLTVGTHTLVVSYSGDAVYDVSTATVQLVVSGTSSTTTLALSKSTVVYGAAVTATATVASATPGQVLTGDVTIKDGSAVVGTKALAAGKATITLPKTLTVGKHTLTATYTGPGGSSVSAGVALQVNFADVPASNQFAADIQWMIDNGITTGFDNGTYRPAAAISREAMMAFLYRTQNPGTADPTCTVAPFTDVSVSSPLCGPIAWAKTKGIAKGFSNGSFHPADTVTREVLITFVYRLTNPGTADPVCTVAPFTDVAVGAPFCGTVAWAKAQGIANGFEDGTFHPASKVDRQAAAAFLHRWSAA